MIPMVDLKGQYADIAGEMEAAVLDALRSGVYILGPNVQALEKETAEYLGVEHAIGVASGTDALHLALLAAGIGSGDEVITTSFTFVATTEAIHYVGATPVYVDIDPDTFNIDADLIETAITDATRAILPVHLYGLPAQMDVIMDIAERHNLVVIEDCAQSIGADFRGQTTGSIGLAGCFSFYPSKNLGCCGDGGLVTTNSADVAEKIRILRTHGMARRYHHDVIGYNSRLDELQAAILRIKLKRLDQFNERRRRVAALYDEALANLPLKTPRLVDRSTHVFHQYTILTPERDRIAEHLHARGVASMIYFPVPLHQQSFVTTKQPTLPHTERVAQECLSLPMYPELNEVQIEAVADTIRECVG
ncbi:MAG: DegT/DnrJ/EryC1/StrS family aminotransferase [Gammaproteobacteria bacterium]